MNLPDRLIARPATVEDIDAVTALIAACEIAQDGVAEIDREDIAADFARPSLDPAKDTLLVFDGETLVAWAMVTKGRRVHADVHPDHQGCGIGAALLARTEARAREAGGALVGQTITDSNTAAAELLRRHGYAPRHTSWIIEIALGGEEPPEPVLPDDIRLRDFVPGQDDREVYQLVEGAFGEQPDRQPASFEDWAALTIRRESFVPGLSPLAVDGDEVVGVALCIDYVDLSEGWVEQLAVQRTHRNRGIARALLHHVFRLFHRMGRRVCGLSTNSLTGALSFYERVGMRVRRSYTHYAKEL